MVTIGNDKMIRLWDAQTGQPVGEPFKGHDGSIYDIAFSPDSRRLASGGCAKEQANGTCLKGEIRMWNTENRQPVASIEAHNDAVLSLAFSPDGKTLASGSNDTTIRRWNVTDGKPIGTPLEGHVGSVQSVVFSPDGSMLASGSDDGAVRLWNTADGRSFGLPFLGVSPVLRVTFSPDGKLLASSHGTGKIQLWDTTTGNPVGNPLEGHSGEVWGLAFSPDGKQLASAELNMAGTVRLWDLDITSWKKHACAVVNRNLEPDEWKRLFGDEPYRVVCPDLPQAVSASATAAPTAQP
jgi:WD40 repeat protein